MTQVRTVVLALAALALTGSACDRNEPRETAQQQQTPVSDGTVTMTVQSRYFGDATVKGHQVDVDTADGVVTLSGTVDSDAARSRAETIAQSVEGVKRVQNNLRVAAPEETARAADPPRPETGRPAEPGAAAQANAGWITTKIQAQYFADADVKGRNIDVTTAPDGKVTLAGQVDTDAERQEAIRIARATEGVREVVDRLRIASAAAEPRREGEAKSPGGRAAGDDTLGDPWITVKIESKYFLDNDVKGRNIDVTTDNGIVTLAGEVSSAGERRQAVLLAQSTEGVKDVRDQLRVSEAKTADAARPPMTKVSDEWIEAKIQSKYFLEDDLKGDDIKVSCARGVVTLQGKVETPEEKRIAEDIARETDGVSRVVSRIGVTSPRGQ